MEKLEAGSVTRQSLLLSFSESVFSPAKQVQTGSNGAIPRAGFSGCENLGKHEKGNSLMTQDGGGRRRASM